MLDATPLLWTRIGAAVCLVIAAGLVFNLLRLRGRIRAAANWSKAAGEIIVSEVRQPPAHVSDDLNDASPVIRYRYRASGQDLESDQVRVGGVAMTTRVLAGKLVARYPVGARVDVYLDPADPSQALLEPRRQDNVVAVLVFAIVFGLVGAVLAAHALAGRVLYAGNGVPLFAFALPVVAFLVAGLSVASFVRARRLATASAGWPTVPGTVTTSDVIEEVIQDKSDDDKSRIRTTRRYQVDLRYAYQVGKRDFVGTIANWGWTSVYGLRELADTAAGVYAPGQRVTVYYDPDQPGTAVLQPDDKQGAMAPLVLAVIAAVVGVTLLAFFVKFGFGG
jgi:hypothetical protein